ncbi:unnamed protein product [Linum tenue]|uniref:Cytochrome P450 n=1 Tax=Linum tenue TaxID=586396 RepID=A0AAV0GWL1_9ROSI|nr:unnamed protein product [Linum tenue]
MAAAALTLLVILVSIIITTLIKKKRAAAVAKHPPPPPSPPLRSVIANLPKIIIHSKPMFRWVHDVMKEMNTDICLIRLPAGGAANIIPVLDPAIAREMLRKQDAVFADRPISFGSHAVSGGYVTTAAVPYNDQWRKMRKVLSSEIVSPARHVWLHDKRAEEADNLVFYVNSRCMAGKCVNLRIATRHYCGNVMRKIMFGRRFFGDATADGGPGPMEVLHVDAVFAALDYLHWSCLSDYFPCLRGWDRLVQESDIERLNYVKACAREAFRLHPLAPFNAPRVGGYFIPKCSHALLSRYGLGRNPKVWVDPLKFDPERHLRDGSDVEVALTEHDLRFISFSTGRRGCLATVLGTCMTTILLARLLQCFAWTPPENAKTVDLAEAEDHLSLATPLMALPRMRLAPHLYPGN